MRIFGQIIVGVFRFTPIVFMCAHAWAQSGPVDLPSQANAVGITSPPGQALSKAEQQAVVSALLANKAVSVKSDGHKTRAIRVKQGFVTTHADRSKPKEYRATVVLFDYTTGIATEYSLDAGTGALITETALRGRPQASEEEVQIATKIALQDPANAALPAASSTVAGGFVVDAPPGKPASHRYIQMKLFRADSARTIRTIVVDLTDDTIASSN